MSSPTSGRSASNQDRFRDGARIAGPVFLCAIEHVIPKNQGPPALDVASHLEASYIYLVQDSGTGDRGNAAGAVEEG